MKNFNGKAIYNPSGKAGEYSYWACNFYVGCSNGCTYCYCKKGFLAGTMGGNTPTLKKCFRDENHALEVFEKELMQNLAELQKHGLFFSFTTDPMLIETIKLTWNAMDICLENKVPVKILTKCIEWVQRLIDFDNGKLVEDYSFKGKQYVAFGFTLTGHDELEPNAPTNAKRIEAMKKLHDAGFKTFASIEPIIDFESSLKMIEATKDFCDLYKIGLESGKKYDKTETRSFIAMAVVEIALNSKIYFKDSILKVSGLNREDLPANCVDRDYNMFKEVKLTKSEFLKQVKGNVINPSAEPQPGAYDLNGVDGFCDKNKLKKARQ